MKPHPGLEVRANEWGLGVFTKIAYQKGALLCPLGGQLVAADDQPNFQVGQDLWVGLSGPAPDQVNHGCEPNCAAMVEEPGRPDRAIRAIAAGEELLADYSATSTASGPGPFKCRCGAASCRGRGGGGFHNVPSEQQERYLTLGIVPSYVTDHYLASLT